MRSWIGLYALLKMIRDAKMTTFTREGISHDAERGEGRPDAGHLRRRGLDAVARPPRHLQAGRAPTTGPTYTWDANAKAPDGLEGNFVEKSQISFDEVLCGTIFGAPKDQC